MNHQLKTQRFHVWYEKVYLGCAPAASPERAIEIICRYKMMNIKDLDKNKFKTTIGKVKKK